MSEAKATRSVIVSNTMGLHARPAVAIADLLRKSPARVELVHRQQRVLGTEVLQILSLGAGLGEQITLEATGPEAEQTLDSLVQLFADRFHEE